MKVVFEITGLSCDLALHPISPQTAESMREGGRDIYSQKYMNWWRRGNTRTFGMRLNESSEIRLQVDGEDVSFNANLLVPQREHAAPAYVPFQQGSVPGRSGL